jgi:hypothetical protein
MAVSLFHLSVNSLLFPNVPVVLPCLDPVGLWIRFMWISSLEMVLDVWDIAMLFCSLIEQLGTYGLLA